MSGPERIWVGAEYGKKVGVDWSEQKTFQQDVEYVRADLCQAPAPSEWDDAIEAAAKKAEERFELCERDNTPPCYLRKCSIAGVIRRLKKGGE